LRGPTDDPTVVREAAARLLEAVDTTGGVRLLGVGVTGLADFTQEDLFAQAADAEHAVEESAAAGSPGERDTTAEGAEDRESEEPPASRRWPAGHDVRHDVHGHGWVQGSGVGRVTVRFEEPWTRPGRVRTFRIDDPELQPADPLPLVRDPADYSSWPASLPKSLSGPVPAEGEGEVSSP
jgi:DNA polymerase IV